MRAIYMTLKIMHWFQITRTLSLSKEKNASMLHKRKLTFWWNQTRILKKWIRMKFITLLAENSAISMHILTNSRAADVQMNKKKKKSPKSKRFQKVCQEKWNMTMIFQSTMILWKFYQRLNRPFSLREVRVSNNLSELWVSNNLYLILLNK